MSLLIFEEEQLDALLAEGDAHEPQEPVVGEDIQWLNRLDTRNLLKLIGKDWWDWPKLW